MNYTNSYKLITYISLFCLFNLKQVVGQNIEFHPDQFGNSYQTLTLTNPVYIDLASMSMVKTGTKIRTGILSDVRTIYAQGYFEIKEVNNNKHWLGIDFVSAQEGPIIRRNRMRINYSLQKQINNDFNIALGTHLGLASFDYNGAKGTTQGSSIGPDGSLAILLRFRKWRMATHINQIFDQVYKPKTITFKYPIYYGYFIEKVISLSSNSEFRIFHLNQIFKNRRNFTTIGADYEFNKTMGIGINYHHCKFLTSTVYSHLGNILTSVKGLKAYFSYNAIIQKQSDTHINSIELGLSFSFE